MTAAAGRAPVRRRVAVARAVRAHVQTWRPYTVWYPGLVGLAGASVAGGPAPAGGLWAAWAAPTLAWVGGHYLGDWCDRELDAVAKPGRPIPSGRLGPAAALWCGVLCVAGSAVAALLADPPAVLVVAVAGLGILGYSRVFKGRGLSGNVVRGALTALTVVFGALVARPGVVPAAACAGYAVVFLCHDTASNLVGALRDVEGDRAGGYRTLPVRAGVRAAAVTAGAAYAGALALALACVPLLPARRGWSAVLLACAALLGAVALRPLLRGRSRRAVARALRAHEVLVAERMVLATALVAAGRGPGPALALALPMLAAALWTQAVMRAGHEAGPVPGGGVAAVPGPVPDDSPGTPAPAHAPVSGSPGTAVHGPGAAAPATAPAPNAPGTAATVPVPGARGADASSGSSPSRAGRPRGAAPGRAVRGKDGTPPC